MSCDDPTFNQTLCQNVTNAGNVQMSKFMLTERIWGHETRVRKIRAGYSQEFR